MSSDEVEKAKEAAATIGDGAPATIFDKILSGDIPANKIHDDDLCIAFRDVNPQAPVHFLVIPKNRDGLTQLSKAREDQKAVLGHMMYVAQKLGQEECPGGFRVVVNDGSDGAQSVYHLHIVSIWFQPGECCRLYSISNGALSCFFFVARVGRSTNELATWVRLHVTLRELLL